MAVAAAVLGHSSPAVTARHYVERAPLGPDVTTVLNAFSDVLDGFPASQIRTDPVEGGERSSSLEAERRRDQPSVTARLRTTSSVANPNRS